MASTFIRVRWIHESSNEPVELWSELDDQRFEVRKVEIFRDGRIGYADRAKTIGGAMLGTVPVPQLNEIATDSAFKPEEISQEAFEAQWTAVLPQS